MPLNVLVTHCWSRIGYNLVRSLAKRGLNVCVGVDPRSGMTRFSRAMRAHFRHPNFELDPEGFIEALESAIEYYKPEVYLPSEEEILVVARNADRLRRLGTLLPIDHIDNLDLLDNKRRLTELAATLGIPTPLTVAPATSEDVVSFAQRAGKLIVLKVVRSSGARGVFFIPADGLLGAVEKLVGQGRLQYGDFILQSFVEGIGYGVSLLLCNGEVRAKFTHRRIREKWHTGGPSTVRISDTHEMLEDYAVRLLKAVGFHGVAMVEFRDNAETGEAWLLEVNPRFWGSLGLAIAAGVDFPYLLYRMARDGDVEPVNAYRKGLTAKWLLGDWLSFADHLKAGRWKKLRQSSGLKTDLYDDFYWDDPLPFLAELVLYARKNIFERRSRR